MTEDRLLFTNARIAAPAGMIYPGWLLTEGTQIRWMGTGMPPEFAPGQVTRIIDLTGGWLLPGFIDLHVHGALGHEVMDADAEGLRSMARFYAQHGVTGFLATTWTATHAAIRAVLSIVSGMMGPVSGGASILGVHLEGPYLNPARCGAQDDRLIRRASPAEALELLDSGIVRLVALAPEFAENLWLADECTRRGIAVSAGHTNATYEEMLTAVAHGVRQVTHCYNAMSPFSHRQPGVVGAALTLPQIACELIADNIHVHPAAMRLMLQAKGPQGVILVTDAIRATGLADGDYPIDTRTITLRDGAARLPDGTLAGSVLTLERGLRNLAAASGQTPQQLWVTSSLNAARAIGVAHSTGSLEAGKSADLVWLNDDLDVQMTVAAGQVVYAG